jgi:hypothetical protein
LTKTVCQQGFSGLDCALIGCGVTSDYCRHGERIISTAGARKRNGLFLSSRKTQQLLSKKYVPRWRQLVPEQKWQSSMSILKEFLVL